MNKDEMIEKVKWIAAEERRWNCEKIDILFSEYPVAIGGITENFETVKRCICSVGGKDDKLMAYNYSTIDPREIYYVWDNTGPLYLIPGFYEKRRAVERRALGWDG
jgi:hypothetical protein